MKKRVSYKGRGGFTLVEAIVVIAITVTLLGVLTTYSKSGENQILFFKEEALLINTITRAKFFAFDAYQPTLVPSPGVPEDFFITERVCGWGVHFNANDDTYILFKDLDPAGPGSDCSGVDDQYSGTDEIFEVFTLDSARIELECVGGSSCSGTEESVVFIPPVPAVVFSSPGTELTIRLALTDGSRSTDIHIGQGGQISTN